MNNHTAYQTTRAAYLATTFGRPILAVGLAAFGALTLDGMLDLVSHAGLLGNAAAESVQHTDALIHIINDTPINLDHILGVHAYIGSDGVPVDEINVQVDYSVAQPNPTEVYVTIHDYPTDVANGCGFRTGDGPDSRLVQLTDKQIADAKGILEFNFLPKKPHTAAQPQIDLPSLLFGAAMGLIGGMAGTLIGVRKGLRKKS
jgi:hypothetical protein